MILKPVGPGGINNVEILTLGWGGEGEGVATKVMGIYGRESRTVSNMRICI